MDIEPLVLAASLAEEGTVMGLMRTKPHPTLIGEAMVAGAQAGHAKIISCILQSRANVNHEGSGRSFEVFISDHGNLDVVAMFLQFSFDPSSTVAGQIFEYAADKGEAHGVKAVADFLKYGLPPRSEHAYMGLQLAAQAGHEKVVASILAAKADASSLGGCEALKAASIYGRYDVVKELLAAGGNAATDAGNEALNNAVHVGNAGLVDMLVKAGSDPSHGLAAASFRGNDKVVKMLLDANADSSSRKKALKEAGRFGHMSILDLLFESGVDARTRDGDSALRLATCNNRPRKVQAEVVQAIEDQGARRMSRLQLAATSMTLCLKMGLPPRRAKSKPKLTLGAMSSTQRRPSSLAGTFSPSSSRHASKQSVSRLGSKSQSEPQISKGTVPNAWLVRERGLVSARTYEAHRPKQEEEWVRTVFHDDCFGRSHKV